MHQVILLGKPNVGKSSLFNILTRKKTAIVASKRNVTRDIGVGIVKHRDQSYMLFDMGGLTNEKAPFLDIVRNKLEQTLCQVDFALVLFDVNAIDGEDYQVMETIRKKDIPHLVVANKCDNDKKEMLLGDIYALGCEKVFPFSCKQMSQVNYLRETIWQRLKDIPSKKRESEHSYDSERISEYTFTLSLIGKPNVGKSSLMNLLVGKERSIISDQPGTTRDFVTEMFKYRDVIIKIIDTAGMRRKNREKEMVEDYSIKKSLGTITRCDVALLIIDATDGLSTQDKKIAAVVHTRNKALVLVVNKWDLIKTNWKDYEKNLRMDFPQIAHVPIIPISCQSQLNIKKLLAELYRVWHSQSMQWGTTELNKLLKRAQYENPPKYHQRGLLKMYYAHQVKTNPPVIKIFINKQQFMEKSYARYLHNVFVKEKKFTGASLKLKFVDKVKE